MTRNCFSFWRQHFKRRRAATDEEIEAWVSEDTFRRRRKREACEDMITAWCQITDEAFQASWEIYEEDAWTDDEEGADGSF
jgi:hypothetical protein